MEIGTSMIKLFLMCVHVIVDLPWKPISMCIDKWYWPSSWERTFTSEDALGVGLTCKSNPVHSLTVLGLLMWQCSLERGPSLPKETLHQMLSAHMKVLKVSTWFFSTPRSRWILEKPPPPSGFLPPTGVWAGTLLSSPGPSLHEWIIISVTPQTCGTMSWCARLKACALGWWACNNACDTVKATVLRSISWPFLLGGLTSVWVNTLIPENMAWKHGICFASQMMRKESKSDALTNISGIHESRFIVMMDCDAKTHGGSNHHLLSFAGPSKENVTATGPSKEPMTVTGDTWLFFFVQW